jgi:hypothetical protein
MVERSDPTILGNDLPRSDVPGDTTVIRAEIRETRERMGDTIEEIGERLNPRRLKEEVKEDIRDATIGRVENLAERVSDSRLVSVVRENPIPAMMVGVGLSWLFFGGRQRSPSRGRSQYVGGPSRGLSDVSLRARYVEDFDKYGEVYVEPTTAYGTTRSTGRTGGVGESVKETAEELADRAQDVAGTVAQQARVQTARIEDQFYENPLAIAAATLALGMAAGLAVPATQAEVELVGEARDKLVDRVRNVARETSEKVTQVAERVMEQKQG